MVEPARILAATLLAAFAIPAGTVVAAGPILLHESFDSSTVGSLPAGWTSSSSRYPGSPDFAVGAGSPLSPPNAALTVNATVGQWIATPRIDLSRWAGFVLEFHLRRSSSFAAALVVELSTDGGRSFPLVLGDTLSPGTPGVYEPHRRVFSDSLPSAKEGVLRLRILPATIGATGTLRLDDVTVVGLPIRDVSISSVSVRPNPPCADDTLQVRIGVRNTGVGPASGVRTRARLVREGSSDTTDIGTGLCMGPVAAGDTSFVSMAAPPVSAGRYVIVADLHMDGDQNTGNDTASTTLVVSHSFGTIAVNEIMYAPEEAEPEWVELFNCGSAPVDLSGWGIADATGIRRELPSGPLPVAADGFAILTRDTLAFNERRPGVRCRVLQVQGFPSLNNSGDAIIVADPSGRVMDSLVYDPSWGGSTDGRSLERRDVRGDPSHAATWGSSVDSLGATPGEQNSIAVLDVDLRIVIPPHFAFPSPGRVSLDCVIRNTGRRNVDDAVLVVWHGDEAAGDTDDVIDSRTLSIRAADSAAVAVPWASPPPGRHTVRADVVLAADMRPHDNRAATAVDVGFPERSLVVNEIMYAPPAGGPEYLEIVNATPYAVDLEGWSVSGISALPIPLSDSACILGPDSFAVLTSDLCIRAAYPAFFSAAGGIVVLAPGGSLGLNNGGDIVTLCDPSGRCVDSVVYSPDWHTPFVSDPAGRSLEKVRPELPSNDGNVWATCVDPFGGTPGAPNSVWIAAAPRVAALQCEPRVFSPDGDGRDEALLIRYSLPHRSAALAVRIYDVRGRVVRHLAAREASGFEGAVVWDGRDDGRSVVRVGMYIVHVECVDEAAGAVISARQVVIRAGKL